MRKIEPVHYATEKFKGQGSLIMILMAKQLVRPLLFVPKMAILDEKCPTLKYTYALIRKSTLLAYIKIWIPVFLPKPFFVCS